MGCGPHPGPSPASVSLWLRRKPRSRGARTTRDLERGSFGSSQSRSAVSRKRDTDCYFRSRFLARIVRSPNSKTRSHLFPPDPGPRLPLYEPSALFVLQPLWPTFYVHTYIHTYVRPVWRKCRTSFFTSPLISIKPLFSFSIVIIIMMIITVIRELGITKIIIAK